MSAGDSRSQPITEPLAVRMVRYLLISGAILAAPFYGLWVLGGYYVDRRGQRRSGK